MQGQAAPRRLLVRSRDMQEDRRAATLPYRVVIISENSQQVVDPIVAPQLFVPARVGKPDRAIVVGVGHVVAPAIVWRDRLARQRAAGGRGQAIRPVQDPAQRQQPAWGGAVAFLLGGADAAFAQDAAKIAAADPEKPAAA